MSGYLAIIKELAGEGKTNINVLIIALHCIDTCITLTYLLLHYIVLILALH